MKQPIRLFAKPGTFMNQMQWSRNHWLIMGAFLGLATIETLIGTRQGFYHGYATMLASEMGIGLNYALAIIVVSRLILITVTSIALVTVTWFLGQLFGRQTSRKVLFRRLAVVFTVALAGYLTQHMAIENQSLIYASYFLYGWSLLLGFFSLKEQFSLNYVEATVLGALCFFMVSTTWHFSNNFFEQMVHTKVEELATRPQAEQPYIELQQR